MADWDARQYLKFEDDRSRPARDLLAQVPLDRARIVVDLGCGPGNSTELLAARYPEAQVSGIDTSEDMLRQARKRLPGCRFDAGDLTIWEAETPPDLIFANAVYQWIPDHLKQMQRAAGMLPEGGVFAAQMPDNTREPSHVAMREVAAMARWAGRLESIGEMRADLPRPDAYYDALKPLCAKVEIWHTVYNHVVSGPGAIVEWFRGSALRPYLAALDEEEATEFVAAYTAEIAPHYPVRFDGRSLLRFPRLFVVAVR
jgi:trans-aconitate 2-methyltransferase